MTAWPELVAAAAQLARGPRRILGITGGPGSGKTVLADALAAELAGRAVVVGMDGFHLSNARLRELRRLDRKGAPDTFDATGYLALLRRLRANTEDTVRAPRFDRAAEEPVADAIVIARTVPLVITEGNYLLLDAEPWLAIAGLLDECWYVDTDTSVRRRRLLARHIAYGRSPEQARERTEGSDERNAALIAGTRARATRIVTVPDHPTDART
jgi:pantothenate kinase